MMREWLIEMLGGYTKQGFPDIASAIRHIRETDDDARYEILQLAMKELFLSIDPEDIFRFDGKGYTYLGKTLSNEQLERLITEANTLKNTLLWRVFRTEIRYQLSRKMFEEGRVKEDFIWGQLATYLWDIMKTKIAQLASMQATLK